MAKSVASARVLIRKAAPFAEVEALCFKLGRIAGVHKVELNHATEWNDEKRQPELTGWRHIAVRGTDMGVRKAKGEISFSGLEELDADADHDHAKCLASAATLGVPAAWAHRPETYLSM